MSAVNLTRSFPYVILIGFSLVFLFFVDFTFQTYFDDVTHSPESMFSIDQSARRKMTHSKKSALFEKNAKLEISVYFIFCTEKGFYTSERKIQPKVSWAAYEK